MRQIVDVIEDFVSKLPLDLVVKSVSESGGNTILTTANTQYLRTGDKVTLGVTEYKVVDFVFNESVTLEGTGLGLVATTYTLASPFYLHGKFQQANIELSRKATTGKYSERNFMPMVYLLEVLTRSKPDNPLSRWESTGDVRLFILNDTNWQYLTDKDYEQTLLPLTNIVKAMSDYYSKFFKDDQPDTFQWTLHSKFTTGRGDINEAENNKVFGKYLSGIELTMAAPIDLCYC